MIDGDARIALCHYLLLHVRSFHLCCSLGLFSSSSLSSESICRNWKAIWEEIGKKTPKTKSKPSASHKDKDPVTEEEEEEAEEPQQEPVEPEVRQPFLLRL